MKACYYLFLLLAIPFFGLSQLKQIKFEHLQTNQGLSQSNVTCILQDSRGFMWFGTRDGLNKYDGYKFTVYRNDPKNKNSISNNYIPDIIESTNGDLWIATWGGGLNRFDRKKEVFISYEHNAKNQNTISGNFITSVKEDSKGNVWIGTEAAGLDMYDNKTGNFVHYKSKVNNNQSISDDFKEQFFRTKKTIYGLVQCMAASIYSIQITKLSHALNTMTTFPHQFPTTIYTAFLKIVKNNCG